MNLTKVEFSAGYTITHSLPHIVLPFRGKIMGRELKKEHIAFKLA